MKKMYKGMLLVLCAVLLVAASVMGTLAYLKSETQTVTNTMSIGNVTIELKEKALDVNTGKQTNDEPVTSLTDIKLIPGRTIDKEPFITVGADSEDCYLFVKVTNSLSEYIDINWDSTKWQQIDNTEYWMYLGGEVSANAVVPVFTSIKCKTSVESNAILTGKSIAITAYAVQAEGFASAQAAWGATFGAPTNP